MRGYYARYNERSGFGIIFILFFIGAVLTIGLYFVKTRAQTAKSQAVRLASQVAVEQSAVKVLRAELAHLENPARLSELSAEKLGLKPIEVETLLTIDDIEKTFPLRDDLQAQR